MTTTTAITGITRIGYRYSDGGRAASGRSGKAADCVVRAATLLQGFRDGLDPADFLTDVWGRLYDATYKRLAIANRDGLGGRRTAREGIYRADYEPVFVNDFGFVKVKLGRGSKPTYSEAYATYGPCIVKTTKHVCALIDGRLYDLSDGRIYDWFGELRERKAQCVYALPTADGTIRLPSGGVYRRMTEAEYYGRERDGAPPVPNRPNRDAAARRRLEAEGIDLDGPLPSEADFLVPMRSGGHGTQPGYLRERRAGKNPCLPCRDAHSRLNNPQAPAEPDFAEEQWGPLE